MSRQFSQRIFNNLKVRLCYKNKDVFGQLVTTAFLTKYPRDSKSSGFEFIYIKDLGVDKTMQHRHMCSPSDLEAVLKIPFYRSILPAVELEADEKMFLMTKWWLSGATFLNSLEISLSADISH